jgi:hypothetical protein
VKRKRGRPKKIAAFVLLNKFGNGDRLSIKDAFTDIGCQALLAVLKRRISHSRAISKLADLRHRIFYPNSTKNTHRRT